jgi:hypothetical protein
MDKPPSAFENVTLDHDSVSQIQFQQCMPCNAVHPTTPTPRYEDLITSSFIPLPDWVRSEENKLSSLQNGLDVQLQMNQQRCAMIRKITVAFAIGKLLRHLKDSVLSYSQHELLRLCSIDNFAVQVLQGVTCDGCWDIMGIDMISPSMSLQVTSLAGGKIWGRDVDAVVTRHSSFCCAKRAAQVEGEHENLMCYTLGYLINFIFSGVDESVSLDNPQENTRDNFMDSFLRSLSISPLSEQSRPTKAACNHEGKSYEMLLPGPISQVVDDLLSCQSGEDLYRSDTAYLSLDSAINDLHLLLLEPNRYIFETKCQLTSTTEIYGRSSEAKDLLDSFSRVVSSGQSEAFLIGGFSG